MRRIALFVLILLVSGCYPVVATGGDGGRDKYQFMRDTNPVVIGGGGYDATVQWGGRTVKVSELKAEFGEAATRRLWNNLDRENRFKILKGYAGWFNQPAYLSKHFGSEVRNQIVRFYAQNTVISKLKERAAERRVSDMLSETIKKARSVQIPTVYGTEGACKEGEKITKEAIGHRNDLQRLISMAQSLEAEKIGIALFEASSFAASQLVGFVTGNVYTQASKMSSLIAEVVMQAKDRLVSAIDSATEAPSAADIINLKNDLQDMYLRTAETAAGLLLEKVERLKGLQEKCQEEYEQEQEEKKQAAAELKEKEEEKARQVQTIPVTVSASYDKDDDQETRERKLASAAAAKLRQLDAEYGSAARDFNKSGTEITNEIHSNDDKEALRKQNHTSINFNCWSPDRVCVNYYGFYGGGTGGLVGLTRTIKYIKEDMPAVNSYQSYNQGLLSSLESVKSNAISTLTDIEGRRRGVISQYGGLMRKYNYYYPNHNDVASEYGIRNMIYYTGLATALDGHLDDTITKMEESIDTMGKQAGELKGEYKEIQATFATLSTNLYLAISKLSKEKARYFQLLSDIGVTKDTSSESWRYSNSIRSKVFSALNENYFVEVKKNLAEKDFAAAAAKMDELFRMADKINQQAQRVKKIVPYVKAAGQDIDAFIRSVSSYASGIQAAINDSDVNLGGPVLEGYYSLFREYSGGAWNVIDYVRGIDSINVDSYFEGVIIINAVTSYNREFGDYLRKKKAEMRSAIGKANALMTNAKFLDQEQFRIAHDEANDLLWAAAPDTWKLRMKFAEETPNYQRWLPATRFIYNGRRLPDIDSEENLQLIQEIYDLKGSGYDNTIQKATIERHERTSQIGISIASILVNGNQYAYPVTLLENFSGSNATISGKVHSGVALDRVLIRVNGEEKEASMAAPTFEATRVVTPYSLDIPLAAGTDVNITVMAYLGRTGRGTSFVIRAFDTQSVAREVREFYNKFQQRYADADLMGVMQFIADDWSASGGRDKVDLQERLDDIFYTFTSLNVAISGLKVQPAHGQNQNYFASATYHIRIFGQLEDSPDIQHREEGDVTDYLAKKDGKLIIIRTVGRGGF